MASRRYERQQETHFQVMRLIHDNPLISTREIAFRLGISNGGAHYCITALVEKGFVKLKNFTQSRSKTNYIYELTPNGIRTKATLTVKFLDRKRFEYNELKTEIQRLEEEVVKPIKLFLKAVRAGMMVPIFSLFQNLDIRGKLGEEIDEDVAYRVGWATAKLFEAKVIAVGFDAERPPKFSVCIKKGITDTGTDVIEIGLSGTEEIYAAVVQFDACAGIEVTASTTYNYNG